jgi:hypothetical protein
MLDRDPKKRPPTEEILKSFSGGEREEPPFNFTYVDYDKQQVFWHIFVAKM